MLHQRSWPAGCQSALWQDSLRSQMVMADLSRTHSDTNVPVYFYSVSKVHFLFLYKPPTFDFLYKNRITATVQKGEWTVADSVIQMT